MLARLDYGERPTPAELLALDIESGVDPAEAQRNAARYADAIGASAPGATSGEAKALAALRGFRLVGT